MLFVSKVIFSLVFFLSSVFSILTPCFGLEVGEVFEIKSDNFVPLFMTSEVNLKYEVGANGNNCYDLDTVLPSGTFIMIKDVPEGKDTVHVSCKVSSCCCFDGFVHKNFFENCMSPISGIDFEACTPQRDILGVREICSILDRIIGQEMPYSYGCNNFEEIDLRQMYHFDGSTKDVPPYRCVGFDCSGLLHYISSWTLPHSTKQLYKLSNENCLLSLSVEATDAEIRDALDIMDDTDFVVFIHDYRYTDGTGHVIVSLHGGFIEAVGKDKGVVFTEKANAPERLRRLLDSARNNGAKDVKIIRWHPELISRDLQ